MNLVYFDIKIKFSVYDIAKFKVIKYPLNFSLNLY